MSINELVAIEGPLLVGFFLALAPLMLGFDISPNRRKFMRGCFWIACAVFAAVSVMWGFETNYPMWARILIVGFLGASAAIGAVESGRYIMGEQAHKDIPTPMPNGQGGKGGDAKVFGSGIAIGGPGGRAGLYGRGGDGGGGEVHGDGVAAGGAGGHAGQDGVWPPPAKSGYEVYQRTMGLSVDPFMRQFGRGGTGAGYEPKLQVVEEIRSIYFKQNKVQPQTIFQNIHAMPLDKLNEELARRNEIWRARIVDEDEYEFFVP
jgi:hypothetical protein